MKFDVGFGTRNALLNRSESDAAYRQDPVEHERVIHQFEQPGQTPVEQMLATEKGIEAEKALPQYWDDNTPRRDLGGSSSWIDGIEYIPSLGIAIMHTISGKEYYYPMTSDELGDWMNSDSLGSYYNRFVKLKK